MAYAVIRALKSAPRKGGPTPARLYDRRHVAPNAFRVCRRHRSALADTRAAFADLVHQLEGHFAKEENVLFPAFEEMAKADREGGHRPALPFPTVLHPIRLMETEHARIETAMERRLP